MAPDYVRLTSDEMEKLPVRRQAQVYDFVEFLKGHTPLTKPSQPKKKKRVSVLELIGTGASHVGDISVNHDKYLYE
jgi:hypothetical protein